MGAADVGVARARRVIQADRYTEALQAIVLAISSGSADFKGSGGRRSKLLVPCGYGPEVCALHRQASLLIIPMEVDGRVLVGVSCEPGGIAYFLPDRVAQAIAAALR